MRNDLTGEPPDDPYERVEFFALRSVARGTGFAGLGVATLIVGCAFSPVLAAHAGTLGGGLITAVLLWKANYARDRPYRETELWIMLDKRHDLPENRAQKIIGEALRQSYLRFARYVGAATLGIWLIGVIMRLSGMRAVPIT